MKLIEYERIIARHEQNVPRKSLNILVKEFGHVPGHILRSIINTHFTRWVRRNCYRFSSSESRAKHYALYKASRDRNEAPGFILRRADHLKFSASLLCRYIIESFLEEQGQGTNKKLTNTFLKDSSLIEDRVLAVEVFMCTVYDPFYGPFSDAKKETVGQDYEIRLKDFLKQKNIAFLDENDLREQGYDKTVDVKLAVPAVIDEDTIITWIESKAAFGDVETHEAYAREQYHSYANRFGPGLVIYWCGFIDELQDCPENITSNARIYIADQPPDSIRSMKEYV